MQKTTESHLHECMMLCWECRDTCQDILFNHSLKGEEIDSENIRLMADCIEICQTAADFMRRNSPLHFSVCGACADVCDACADSCEEMGKEDAVMKRCAEICRRCASSCHAMSKMKHAA